MNQSEGNVKRTLLSTLSTKVGLFVLILLTITITNVTVSMFSKMQKQVISSTEAHMSDIAKNSATTVALAVKNLGDIKQLTNAPVLLKMANESELEGIKGSYTYVVALDGTMIAHPTAEKIGKPVENETVKEVLSRMKKGEAVAPFAAEYEYHGGIQVAAIHPDMECGFVLVVVASEDSIISRVNSLRSQSIFMNAITVLVYSVVGVLFIYFLMRPLQEATAQTKRLTELDLTSDEKLEKMMKRKDEVGEIAEAIVQLQKKLYLVIEDIKAQSVQLYEASGQMNEQISDTACVVEQVSSTVQEIANGASSQAEDTQRATEQVVTMGNAVEKANREVGNLYGSTDAVKASGEEAVETLLELTEINRSAKDAIEVIYTQTNMTNESVKKIRQATTLITEIADETNLLSLNASIEAARAGEAGRGFAVVAAQIQKLAEQSNESANQIEHIINLLTENSEKAVVAMKEVKDIMQKQEEKVIKTEQIILDVRDKIDQSIDGVGVIAESTGHIDETRRTVIDLVQSLSAIAEENAASTEETSASVTEVGATMNSIADNTERLKEIAECLEQSMELFKLS